MKWYRQRDPDTPIVHEQLRHPVTPEQYNVIAINDEVSIFLVRAAQGLDLEALSQRLRGAA